MNSRFLSVSLSLLSLVSLVGCGPKVGNGLLKSGLVAPTGGSLAAVADGRVTIEAVIDRSEGDLKIYTWDAEAKAPLRTASEGLELRVAVGLGEPRFLILAPVASVSAGTFAGDTALYQGQADWLKTTSGLTIVVDTITGRGRKYSQIKIDVPAAR